MATIRVSMPVSAARKIRDNPDAFKAWCRDNGLEIVDVREVMKDDAPPAGSEEFHAHPTPEWMRPLPDPNHPDNLPF